MLMQFIEDISITDLLWILITEMQRKAQSEWSFFIPNLTSP
jgi:hypothetical protein